MGRKKFHWFLACVAAAGLAVAAWTAAGGPGRAGPGGGGATTAPARDGRPAGAAPDRGAEGAPAGGTERAGWYGFTWEPGARQSYRFHLASETRVNTAASGDDGPWQEVAAEIDGTLNLRILRRREGFVYAGFQLSPVRVVISGRRMPALESLYRTFFLAVLAPSGQPVAFHFPAGLSEEDGTSLAEVVNAVQVVAPVDRAVRPGDTWTVEESHGTGTYEARYEAASLDPLVLYKEKTGYSRVASTASAPGADGLALSGRVRSSRFQAKVAASTSWLVEFSGAEEVAVASKQGLVTEATNRVALSLLAGPLRADLEVWAAPTDVEALLVAFRRAGRAAGRPSGWEEERRAQLRQKFAGQRAEDLVARIAAPADAGVPYGELVGRVHDLRDYLTVFPEASDAVADFALAPGTSDRAAGMALHALELAGHPAAQLALERVMGEAENDARAVQAIVAAGGLEAPDWGVVDTLWGIVDAADPADAEIADERPPTALLALGTIGATLEQRGDEAGARRVRTDLAAFLQETGSAPWQTVALKALGNAQGPDLAGAVAPYVAAEDERVRAAAVQELGHGTADEALPVLADRLANDASVRVRGAALQGLTALGTAAVPTVSQRVSAEPDARLRGEMVSFLGTQKDASPDVVETLEAQLAAESSREVKKQIYRALYR